LIRSTASPQYAALSPDSSTSLMTRTCAILSMASFSAREKPPSLSRTWTILFMPPAAWWALPAPDEALPAIHAVGRLAAPPSRVLGLAAGPLGKPGVHHLAAIGAAAHGGHSGARGSCSGRCSSLRLVFSFAAGSRCPKAAPIFEASRDRVCHNSQKGGHEPTLFASEHTL
jgi:hypothetical protein